MDAATWDLDRLRRERQRLATYPDLLDDASIPVDPARLDAAYERLSTVLVGLLADPVPADRTGATAQAAVDVRDHRQRLECLHLALGGLVDQLADLTPDQAAATLTAPVRVVFTTNTNDPAQTVEVPPAGVLRAARAELAAIRALVDGYDAALAGLVDELERAAHGIAELSEADRARFTARLPTTTDPIGSARDSHWHDDMAALRAEARGLLAVAGLHDAIDRLRAMTDEVRAWQLGDGLDPLAKLELAPLLDRLGTLEPAWRDGRRWDVESAEGLLVELTDAIGRVHNARRRQRNQAWSELTGLFHACRQKAADDQCGEAPRLLALERSADTLLSVRPFRIGPAADAVHAYLRAVNEERR